MESLPLNADIRAPDFLTGDLPEQVRRLAPLLLLLARETLGPEQIFMARRLSDGFDDWEEFAAIAQRKFCLPFVYQHVAALDLVPEHHPSRRMMRDARLHQAQRWLGLLAEQRRFLETVLVPAGVDHAFVKGVSLSRYYRTPSLRSARDIDVLLDPSDVRPVLFAAAAQGYRVMLDVERGQFAETDRDLRAVCRYKSDIPLLSPNGALIEIHTKLHKGIEIFSTRDLLDRTETAVIQGSEYRVLPTADLFIFLAYHHNRHLWSSLHWMADVDAVRSHATWDEAEVKKRAVAYGLDRTVEATLAFAALSGAPDRWSDVTRGSHAAECLELCLLNLEGGLDRERDLYRTRIHAGADWREPRKQHARAWRHVWKMRFTPTIREYSERPLPDWLHWLYPVSRAAGSLRRRSRSGRGQT